MRSCKQLLMAAWRQSRRHLRCPCPIPRKLQCDNYMQQSRKHNLSRPMHVKIACADIDYCTHRVAHVLPSRRSSSCCVSSDAAWVAAVLIWSCCESASYPSIGAGIPPDSSAVLTAAARYAPCIRTAFAAMSTRNMRSQQFATVRQDL